MNEESVYRLVWNNPVDLLFGEKNSGRQGKNMYMSMLVYA